MRTTFTIFIWILLILDAGAEESTTLEKRINTTKAQQIEINGFSGTDIKFRSWDNDEVYIKLRISISSTDEEYEKKLITSAKITDNQSSSSIRLQFEKLRESPDGWSIIKSIFKGRFYTKTEIKGEIFVPRLNPLSTDLRYGTVSLEGMSGELRLYGKSNTVKLRNCSSVTKIENDYGSTTIESSGGKLNLNGNSSTVTIKDFNGSVDIVANYSTVEISRVSQGLTVEDKSGKVVIEDIRGDAKIYADYSSITIGDVRGYVSVRSKSSAIRIRSVDGVKVDAPFSDVSIIGVKGTAGRSINVTGQSGNLSLENASGDLYVDNPYSSIEIKRLTGNVDIKSKSSTIIADNIIGNWKSATQYSDVKLRRFKGDTIVISNKSNVVSVRTVNIPSLINIENDYGDVIVHQPAGFSGEVDLYAEDGTVNTNYPITNKKNRKYAYQAKIGTGSWIISIETKSANIELIQD